MTLYPGEDCPKSLFIRKSIGCISAGVFGLLVCVADIRLPEETALGDARGRLAELMAGDPVLSMGYLDRSQDSESADLSAPVFVPAAEPNLEPYDLLIHAAAGRYDVDGDLIRAIIMVESQFNPGATSKKGARGLMQLMPVTAAALDVTNIHSPEENINAGARHLRWLLERFDGNLRLALAAYNAGEQNVMRYQGVPPFPETRAYIMRVLEGYAAMKADSL